MSPQTTPPENRLWRLYRTHAADAARLAHLLCDDRPIDRTNAAFVKTMATFRDLRSLTFEAALRRAVIKQCRPSLGQRWARAARARSSAEEVLARGRLWEAFRNQSHRRRAALVLRYFESMSDDQVADVLGCSTGTARTLVNRALAALQPAAAASTDPGHLAGELQRMFRAKAESAPHIVEPDAKVVSRAAIGRGASAVGAVLLVLALGVASFLTIRWSGTSGGFDPSPLETGGPDPVEVLSLLDQGLLPDARLSTQTGHGLVASGAFANETWHVVAEPGPGDEICLVLRVGADFGRSHCESRALSVLHGFVDAVEDIDATFITGYALEEVRRVSLQVDDEETIPVELVDGPRALPRHLQRRFFVVILPDALVPLSSEEEGADQGYTVIRTVLQGKDADGASIQHQPIYLGNQ